MPKEPHCMPPVDLETIFQIDGISGEYCYPNGMSAAKTERNLTTKIFNDNFDANPSLEEKFNIASDWYKTFTNLNPELQKLTPYVVSSDDMIHTMIGTTSGFNISDIEYYFTTPIHKKRKAHSNGHFKVLLERTNFIDMSSPLQWGVSPQTANLIHQKLDKKYGKYEFPEFYKEDHHYSQFINWPPYQSILQSYRTGKPVLATNVDHVIKHRLAEMKLG